MNSFKKFVFIALMPVVLMAIVSIILTSSFDDVSNMKVNIFTVGFFSIISFCYVYIFKSKKVNNQNMLIKYIHSMSCVFSLTFIFCYIFTNFLFNDFKFKTAVSQATLATGLFLITTFVIEIYRKTIIKEVLVIKEKPVFFITLILKVVFIQSVLLLVLSIDSIWNDFEPIQIINRVVEMLILNLKITLSSFIILSVFYNINYFRKKIALSLFLASVLSSILNLFFNDIWGQTVFARFISIFLICFFNCSVIVITIIYRNKIQKLSLSFSKKETEYLQLKNQINPHFLFNNLNTLIAFIETNPQKAIEFGHHLSNVYRHYLKNDEHDFVLLKDELQFISEYLAIFKAKFENGFSFEIENEAASTQYILSLSLQEIVDNVFKHNILDIEKPVAIKISIHQNKLIISNTKIWKEAVDSTKKGLENINKRYNLLSKKEITVTEKEHLFEVKIPILHLTK